MEASEDGVNYEAGFSLFPVAENANVMPHEKAMENATPDCTHQQCWAISGVGVLALLREFWAEAG